MSYPPPRPPAQQPYQPQQQDPFAFLSSTTSTSSQPSHPWGATPSQPPPQQWTPQPQQSSWNPPPQQPSWTPPPPQQQQPQWQPSHNTNSWSNSDPWGGMSTTSAAVPSSNWPTTATTATSSDWGSDPFAVFQNTSTMSNSASFRMNTTQQAHNTSNNPFEDEAGFFSSFTAPPAAAVNTSRMQQQQQPVDNTPPPSAKTQRLLRVASMLFERGALIRADKIFLQELVLKQDKRAESALERAEEDGSVDAISRLLYNERSGLEGDEEDRAVQMASNATKKRPSMMMGGRKNSDEDDEQTESLPTAKYSNEAPHPAAGGFSAPIPANMFLDNNQFTGQILVRVSSKKMFRKWKPAFFCVERTRVVLYEGKQEWMSGSSMPMMVIPLHECMWIAKPSLKKTYSLIDDGKRVYFSTLKENTITTLNTLQMNNMPRPVTYTPAIETRVVAKFASYFPEEISAFAHSMYSVVLLKQKEAKAAAVLRKDGSGRMPQTSRQASSGFMGRS